MTLQEFFTEHPKAALGYSGGVDSSYLLWAAVNAGADIAPYYIQTAFQPAFELEDAQRLCAQIGVKLNVIRLDALADPVWRPTRPTAATTARWGYSGRCGPERRPTATTFCWTAPTPATTRATAPGMKALREMEVRSPLRECGLTKAMIRQESRKAGLFTWDKPAYACLAPVPTGRTITSELLRRVEGLRRRCLPWALRISGCGCTTRPPGSNCPRASWPKRWSSGRPSGRRWLPGLTLCCWTPRRDEERPMEQQEILNLLQQVADGSVTPQQAQLQLKMAPFFEDLGFCQAGPPPGAAPGRGRSDLRSRQNAGADPRHCGGHAGLGPAHGADHPYGAPRPPRPWEGLPFRYDP